jgi:hypothetical protein
VSGGLPMRICQLKAQMNGAAAANDASQATATRRAAQWDFGFFARGAAANKASSKGARGKRRHCNPPPSTQGIFPSVWLKAREGNCHNQRRSGPLRKAMGNRRRGRGEGGGGGCNGGGHGGGGRGAGNGASGAGRQLGAPGPKHTERSSPNINFCTPIPVTLRS